MDRLGRSARPGPRGVRPRGVLLALCLSACAGSYDPEADRAVSALQRSIDRHIVALAAYADPGRPAAARRVRAAPPGTAPSPGWVAGPAYADSEIHYGDVDSAFAGLDARLRAAAAAGSRDQVRALSSVRAIARLMAQEHRRLDVLPLVYLQATRDESWAGSPRSWATSASCAGRGSPCATTPRRDGP